MSLGSIVQYRASGGMPGERDQRAVPLCLRRPTPKEGCATRQGLHPSKGLALAS